MARPRDFSTEMVVSFDKHQIAQLLESFCRNHGPQETADIVIWALEMIDNERLDQMIKAQLDDWAEGYPK